MAINVVPCCSNRRWSAKQYILAALIGTQVAIAIAVVFSIVLSPAHVYFSIADAQLSQSGEFYNFTLVANNTSRRTKVQYLALNFEIWHSETGYVPAEFNTSELPLLQPQQNSTRIPVSAEYWQNNVANRSPPPPGSSHSSPPGSSDSSSPESSESSSPECLVVVKAQVKFKIGTAFTRPYNVRVSCPSVNFFSDDVSALVNCTG